MKRGWYKNSYTGDVVFLCGSNDSQVFYRVRSGETTYERKPDFYLKYKPIKASGFPPVKPKEFKPRYAIYDRWQDGEAYVEEFEPGKFKVVDKDGNETDRPINYRFFKTFFDQGPWKVVPEAEAKARLDKPKDFKPRYAILDTWRVEAYVEEFEPGKFKVVCKDGSECVEPLAWKPFASFFEDGTYKVVPEAEAKARLDKPKAEFNPRPVEKPKKKVLVEWAILLKATPNDGYYTRLVPEGRSPATSQKKFKTGRTVEVPE